MNNRALYSPPRFSVYVSEVEYPNSLKSAIAALRLEARRKLSSGWKHDSEYMAAVDNDRRYIEVSEGFRKLNGYDREQSIGKKYDD